jgi:hypothetical protein
MVLLYKLHQEAQSNNIFILLALKLMLATWMKWPTETKERILSLASSKFIFNSNNV